MASKDDIIADLRRLVEEQSKRLDAQAKRIEKLELQLAKAQKDSSNSSKSPSSDIVKPPKKKTDRRKKVKRGGQEGHPRKLREPLPPERVDQQITYEIHDNDVRRLGLTPSEEFQTVQHIELLDMPIHVTEYRLREYYDSAGNVFHADVPDFDSGPIFGPRMLSMIGWLKSRAHCSYTTIEAWMEDILQVPVSRGYLTKLCTGVISESLGDAHEELKAAIPRQSQLGSDETSIKNNGKKHWIWCITAATFSLFHIAATRSRDVLEELIGDEFKGHLNFDYFSANCSFAWNFDIKAQYCWAHLIRDIRFLQKHPKKKTKVWADDLLDRSRRLFSAWHRRDEMTEAGFHQSMLTHRERFLEIVRRPPDSKEASNLAARFALVDVSDGSRYDMSQDYFRFMFAPDVEPTNNHSEQQVRHCVIDRRITQGTRSNAGERYHERMWSAIATCGKQKRSFFNYLHASITARLAALPAPSLLSP